MVDHFFKEPIPEITGEKNTDVKTEKSYINTRIEYLYRDASNYKKYNVAVISGILSDDQIDTIIQCLQDKEFFIPCQVGLPEERFEELTEDDHGWFEMDKSGFSVTNDLPTVQITAEDLYSNFINAKDAWHDDMF